MGNLSFSSGGFDKNADAKWREPETSASLKSSLLVIRERRFKVVWIVCAAVILHHLMMQN